MDISDGLYAVIGVFVGACISAASYLLKIREERKRNLRKCLFALLEIWHDLRSSSLMDLDVWINTLLNEAEKRFPGEQVTAEAETLYKEQLRPIVANFVSALPKAKTEKTLETFSTVIDKLSEYDPLLAYALNGRQELKALLSALDRYYSDAQKSMPALVNDASAEAFFDALVGKVNRESFKDVIKDLEQDILAVSAKAKYKRKTRELIDRVHAQDKKVLTDAITKILDEIEIAARTVAT